MKMIKFNDINQILRIKLKYTITKNQILTFIWNWHFCVKTISFLLQGIK